MQLKQILPLALLGSVSGQSTQSLVDALNAQNSSLSTLNGLLQSTGLLTKLSNLQNVTLLAPNNEALTALLNSTAAASLVSNPGALSAFLTYHILNGTYSASSFGNQSLFPHTELSNETYANITGGQVVEGRAFSGGVEFFSALKQNVSVVTPNINFTGGIVHVINGVLSIPGNVTNTLADANLTAAAGAIRTANLETSLGGMRDVTIFAPNNAAFDSIGNMVANLSVQDLSSVLGYHVVTGVAYSSSLKNETLTSLSGQQLKLTILNGTVFVNAAKVTLPDVLCSNGVIHVIDQVLNPANSTATPDPSATTAVPAFSGASTGTGVPFTSGIATPTTTFPAATSAGGAASTSTSGQAIPMRTAAVGAAALFGGAAMLANF